MSNENGFKTEPAKQQIELKPKLGGFLWSYIIFSIPGFVSGLIWTVISVIVLVTVVAGVASNANKSQESSVLKLRNIQSAEKAEGVLVYDLKGLILSSSTDTNSSINRTSGIYIDTVQKDFAEIKKNTNIKNVVFRVNTPGGEMYASQILGDLINDLLASKNQVQGIFYFDQISASGGLWATYKNPSNYVVGSKYGETGSIGVILSLPNFKGLAEKVGYSENVIKSSSGKDIGNPLRDITNEEKVYFQAEVDKNYDKFIDVVSTGRKIPKDEVKKFATGLTFENQEAKTLGLLDEIGDVQTAIKKSAANANLGSDFNVWEVKNETRLIDNILGTDTISNLMGIPQNATKALDKATFFDSGKLYLVDEYKI